VKAAANLVVEGHEFAPTFFIWTTIEECLNPPVVWERGRQWYTTEPFSEPETFTFPAGIGSGVLGPEALPAEPFLELLNSHGAPWECEERTPRD
jgi:hypothetical protein